MAARGVNAALQERGIEPGAGIASALDDDAAQAELFAEEMREQARDLDNGQTPAAWDGKGRKPGARNKRTAQVVDFIQNTGVDPLIFWNRILSMTPEQVKTRYALEELADAISLQMQAADKLAEYMHPKLARVELKVESRHYERVQMSFMPPGTAVAPDIDGGKGLIVEGVAALVETTQNQGLSEDEGSGVTQSGGHTDAPTD